MGALIGVIDREGKDATKTAATMLGALSSTTTETFGLASLLQIKTERTIEALRELNLNSQVIVGYRCSRILQADRPKLAQLEGAALAFDGRVYAPGKAFPPKSFAGKLLENGEQAAKTFVDKSEGDYAFCFASSRRLIAGRDPIGVVPLYYGENAGFAALASERKALWKIGICTTSSFPPGHVAVVDQNGFKFEPVKTLSYWKPQQITMKAAASKLEALLRHSIMQRVSSLREVAVAFSGGLDSSIVAMLARESGLNTQLIHVSLENQKETEHAETTAEILKLPIHIRILKEEDVEEVLPKALPLIEEFDPVKTSIGLPIYWVAEQAAQMGFKVLLAGQGADELFGGYKRYVDCYFLYGEEEVRKRIFQDVVTICETNLERDFKICNFHNVELRLPFATFETAKFALSLPVKLKIDLRQAEPRKLVLRRVAKNIGLPECVVEKSKKAVQYSTGVDKAIKRLARGQGTSVRDYLQRIFQKTLKENI